MHAKERQTEHVLLMSACERETDRACVVDECMRKRDGRSDRQAASEHLSADDAHADCTSGCVHACARELAAACGENSTCSDDYLER